MSRLRVGAINYINPLPLFAGFQQGECGGDFEWVPHIPAKLNQDLVKGKLDLSLISVETYLSQPEKLHPLPQFGVAAIKEVRSVHLYSRYPLDQLSTALNGAKVGHTTQGASSLKLLSLLFRDHWKVQVDLAPLSLGNEIEEGKHFPAFLLIGDQALATPHIPGYHTIDLVTQWNQLTGLPFVFAIFAARKEVWDQRPDEILSFIDAVEKSLSWSMSHEGALIRLAQKKQVLPEQKLREYFKLLRYRLGDDEKSALQYFTDLRNNNKSLSRIDHDSHLNRASRPLYSGTAH